MNKTITITNKGQTTIPVMLRRKLGLDKNGGVLRINFNERKGEIVISKPVDPSGLSQRISRYVKPGKKPLLNVDQYYQTNRKAA